MARADRGGARRRTSPEERLAAVLAMAEAIRAAKQAQAEAAEASLSGYAAERAELGYAARFVSPRSGKRPTSGRERQGRGAEPAGAAPLSEHLIYAARSVARFSAKGGKSAGLQRLALLVFAALFVLLFVVFAIAQGIGHPSVPSGDVAVIEDAPDGLSPVSEAEFKHALIQAAAEDKVTPVPKPGDEKYERTEGNGAGQLLDTIWIQGQAEELGISVTPKEIAEELKKLKKNFKTEQQYKEFLKEAHFTQADVNTRVTIQMLSKQIQEQVTEEAPIPEQQRNRGLLRSRQASQYTTPESRDIRVIKNQTRPKSKKRRPRSKKTTRPKAGKRSPRNTRPTRPKAPAACSRL